MTATIMLGRAGVPCGFAICGDIGRTHGNSASTIAGHCDVSFFLLLDDPAHQLFLSVGLDTDRILTALVVLSPDFGGGFQHHVEFPKLVVFAQ
jgi:hypothetical protein